MKEKQEKVNRIIEKLERLNEIRKRKQDVTLAPLSKSDSR